MADNGYEIVEIQREEIPLEHTELAIPHFPNESIPEPRLMFCLPYSAMPIPWQQRDIPSSLVEEGEPLSKFEYNQIPRFPSNLDRISKKRDYIAPRTVAIGPYYFLEASQSPALKPMQQIKQAAVHYFFEGLEQSPEAIRSEIRSIAGNARRCYTDKDAVQDIHDDTFSEMMFVDGCFLVQFIHTLLGWSGPRGRPFRRLIHPHTNGILRDMMLLENQIPWTLMEVLMPLKKLKMEHIIRFLVDPCLHGTVSDVELAQELVGGGIHRNHKPAHLLSLVWSFEAARHRAIVAGSSSSSPPAPLLSGNAVPVFTSAVDLAEIGVDLQAASQTRRFSAMNITRRGPLCTKLLLAPLNLEDTAYCWLVNLAAFEMWAETSWDDCSVNSYLAVLSLLVHREEDVRELRARRVVHGTSSDRQALEFFKDLVPSLSEGKAYWRVIGGLERYRQKRRAWIAVYRFVYKNYKTMATVLSIASVLVGFFKALLSLKQK